MEAPTSMNSSVCSADNNSVTGTATNNSSFPRDRSMEGSSQTAATATAVQQSPARPSTTIPSNMSSPQQAGASSAPPTPSSTAAKAQAQLVPPPQRQPPPHKPQNLDDLFGMQQVVQPAAPAGASAAAQQQQPPHQHNPFFDTDDHTEPSSANDTHDASTATTGTNPAAGSSSTSGRAGYTRTDLNTTTSTFGRSVVPHYSTSHNVLDGTNDRKRMGSSSNNNNNDRNRITSADEEDLLDGAALIYGYLKKLGRNGKWQTRWFETDGECLTYYKSSKRTKVLATLDISKVGSIVVNPQDEQSFIIHISDRPYYLRADSKAACKDWVITLNRVKEARMHQGNVQLVPDFLDDQHRTPRVVVVANRQRTRAVDEDSWETGLVEEMDPAVRDAGASRRYYDTTTTTGNKSQQQRVKWQKPSNSIKQLASKVLRWARSLRQLTCQQDAEHQVVLDHHVHPPGHDDYKKRSYKSSSRASTSTSMAGAGSSNSNNNNSDSNNVMISASHSISTKDSGMGGGASSSQDNNDDDDFDEELETRELS